MHYGAQLLRTISPPTKMRPNVSRATALAKGSTDLVTTEQKISMAATPTNTLARIGGKLAEEVWHLLDNKGTYDFR